MFHTANSSGWLCIDMRLIAMPSVSSLPPSPRDTGGIIGFWRRWGFFLLINNPFLIWFESPLYELKLTLLDKLTCFFFYFLHLRFGLIMILGFSIFYLCCWICRQCKFEHLLVPISKARTLSWWFSLVEIFNAHRAFLSSVGSSSPFAIHSRNTKNVVCSNSANTTSHHHLHEWPQMISDGGSAWFDYHPLSGRIGWLSCHWRNRSAITRACAYTSFNVTAFLTILATIVETTTGISADNYECQYAEFIFISFPFACFNCRFCYHEWAYRYLKEKVIVKEDCCRCEPMWEWTSMLFHPWHLIGRISNGEFFYRAEEQVTIINLQWDKSYCRNSAGIRSKDSYDT